MIKDDIKKRLGSKIINWHQHAPRRVYVLVNPQDIKEVAMVLFKELNLRLATASGVDTSKGLEIVYHFSFDRTGEMISVRVLIDDKRHPEIDSIAAIFPGAEWIEREMWEMLGINFKGHPNLTRLLLAEEWPVGKHPLRKERSS